MVCGSSSVYISEVVIRMETNQNPRIIFWKLPVKNYIYSWLWCPFRASFSWWRIILKDTDRSVVIPHRSSLGYHAPQNIHKSATLYFSTQPSWSRATQSPWTIQQYHCNWKWPDTVNTTHATTATQHNSIQLTQLNTTQIKSTQHN